MSKVNLNTVTSINSLSVINSNFDKLAVELQDKVLYRDNPTGEPNSWESDIDANGKKLYNLGDLDISGSLSINGDTLQTVINDTVLAPVLTSLSQTSALLSTALTAATSASESADIAQGYAELATTASIPNNSVPPIKLTNVATATFLGRATAGTGQVEVMSAATAKALLNLNESAEVNVFSYMSALEKADVLGASVLDHTAAVTAALAALPNGGVLLYPAGKYNINGSIVTTVNGVTHRGQGRTATQIKQTSATGDLFVFNSTQFSGVESMKIVHTSVPSAGWAVRFVKTASVGCFFGFAKDLYIQNLFNGIEISGSTETRVQSIHLRGLVGLYGVRFAGAGAGLAGAYRAVIEDCVGDTAGNGNTSLTWYSQDSYAYSLVINKCSGLYGGKLFLMSDTANTGTSFPMWCYAWDFEGDHTQFNAIELLGGEGFVMSGSWIGSSLSGGGIVIGSAYRGEIDVSTTRIMGHALHGVLLQSGPVEVNFHNNMIGANSQSAVGSYHGIVVGANASRFRLRDNRCGSLASGGSSQGYGILILAGTSTDYHITNNSVSGNITGGLLNAAPSGTATVSGNT